MRHWQVSVLTVFGVLIGLLVGGVVGQADDYEIKDYRIQVNVQKNGNASVTQRIKYNFDGDFHGVYYQQDLRGIGGVIGQPTVSVQRAGQSTKTLKASDSQANQTFLVTKSADQLKMKVFYPISDSQATYTYRYQLRGVVTNYLDTAELNWKIIGTGWDVDQNNVHITVQLPATNIKQLQAWTHGPLSGRTTVNRQAGKVTMTVGHNPANQFIESHLLFPTVVTATNPNVVRKNVKQAKQKQEAKLAAAANQKRRQQERIAYGAAWTSLLVGLLTWLFALRWQRSQTLEKYPPVAPINHSYSVPTVPAAVAQSILNNGRPDQKAFSATLLELAAQKRLQIEEVTAKHGKPTYALTALDSTLVEKPAIMRRLFHTIGDDQTVTLKQVQAYGKTTGGPELVAAFEDWQGDVRTAAEATNYQAPTNILVRQRLGISALVGAITGLIAVPCLLFTKAGIISWSGLAALLLIIGGAGYWLWQRQQIALYSESGAHLVAELRGFRRMLSDVGHFDMAKVGDLILWEQILPYAVAFGEAKRVVKALRANFSEAELQAGMGIYYPMYFGYVGADFTNSFSQDFGGGIAAGSPDSSAGGGSGGFSGGSSGGFGGGSGGGAF